MEVVPQGPCIIITSRKEGNTSPMGEQQHTMIIYIIISSEVTNTSTHATLVMISLMLSKSQERECKSLSMFLMSGDVVSSKYANGIG